MKPRTVVVEIEMETTETINGIRNCFLWLPRMPRIKILEVRVNVIRATKRKARGKARRAK